MTCAHARRFIILASVPMLLTTMPAEAHKLRQHGLPVTVADSPLTVRPERDWNSLSKKVGKNTETWTLDGEQLNDITFYGGIENGKPLLKEKNKKSAPLPKFKSMTLLIEVPELLEGTYRSYKNSGSFQTLSTSPMSFLGQAGVNFTYEFTDEDQLTRRGEARAAIIGGKLFMITFEAPRLNYFDKVLPDYRALADTAQLN